MGRTQSGMVGLLFILDDFKVLVGDKLVVAFRRQIDRGGGNGKTGQNEDGPRGSAQGPRGIQVPALEEPIVVVKEVGLLMLAPHVLIAHCAGLTYHNGHADTLHEAGEEEQSTDNLPSRRPALYAASYYDQERDQSAQFDNDVKGQ